MKYIILIFFFFITSLHAKVLIYDTKLRVEVTNQEFLTSIPNSGQVILGEYHYQEKIQKAQAKIIKEIVGFQNRKSSFSVFWEFLDYPKQETITNLFHDFLLNEIEVEQLLDLLFPMSQNKEHYKYRHFLSATKALGGSFFGANAPRKWKRVITKEGMDKLDPELIPSHYEIGSTLYLERFKVAMGGHVPDDMLKPYFQAQSFTDSVIANSLMDYSNDALKFLIIGSFHSDYNDGVVREINKISKDPTTTIKLVDTSEMSIKEVESLKKTHPTYGRIADYLYLLF